MTSPAGIYDIYADQGATFSRRITIDVAGVALNLTGYTAKMQVRETVDSPTVLLELSTANGRITLGGVAGTIDLTVSANVMEALPSGQFVYDLELTSGGGVVTRIVKGSFVNDPEVTR